MSHEIERIILRNLLGEATYEDIVVFSEWLSSSDKHKATFLRIKKYWDADVSGAKLKHPEITYNRLLDRIRKAERKKTTRRLWLKYAGAAVIALLVGIAGFWIGEEHEKGIPVEHYSYITGNSISSFELPDGTEISLNKNSTLSYTSLYGRKNREVSLEGEGFFHVVKDKHKSFIVDLNGSKISVLGTVFNVKNYKKENLTTTTLVEGSIRFETPDQQILLTPDQQLVFNRLNKQIDIESVSSDLVTAWKNNLIKYKSITFSEFVNILAEQYDVEITIMNKELESQRVTGAFDNNLTVDQILDLMKKNLSFNWQKQGNKYMINK